MFNKKNSKALTALNAILLLQIIFSIIALIWNSVYFIIPDEYHSTNLFGPLRYIATAVSAGFIAFVANKLVKLFDVKKAGTEKLFHLISLLTINTALTALLNHGITYLEDGKLSTWSGFDVISNVTMIITYASAVALVHKYPVFSTKYSSVLNIVNLWCSYCFTGNFAWFLSQVVHGPDTDSWSYQHDPGSFAREVIAHLLIGLTFGGVILFLVKNATKLTKAYDDEPAEETKPAEEAKPTEAVSAPETKSEEKPAEPAKEETKSAATEQHDDIKNELEATRAELAELKKLLQDQKKDDNSNA